MSETPEPSDPSAQRTEHPLLAIDGPGGSGKSSVSRRVAAALGAEYVDTGAMYRAMTWLALDRHVDLSSPDALSALVDVALPEVTTDPLAPEVRIAGTDVTEAIRGDDVTGAVSVVSAVAPIRQALVRLQRDLAEAARSRRGVVVEGRDIGTVVLPDAPLKVYLTASAEARARRRAGELGRESEHGVSQTKASIEERDTLDSTRAVSPLAAAADAVVVDSTEMTLEQVVEAVLGLAAGRGFHRL